MSKTRKRSTKKTSSKRAKPAKSRRVKKARMVTVEKAGYVELGPIRTKLKADVETLGDAISKSPAGRPELEEALKRMSRFLADIDDICGSNMMLAIS